MHTSVSLGAFPIFAQIGVQSHSLLCFPLGANGTHFAVLQVEYALRLLLDYEFFEDTESVLPTLSDPQFLT